MSKPKMVSNLKYYQNYYFKMCDLSLSPCYSTVPCSIEYLPY